MKQDAKPPMIKSYRTEFYPDGFTDKGLPNGRKAFTMSFTVNNSARTKAMTDDEKGAAVKEIEDFERKVALFKKRFEK